MSFEQLKREAAQLERQLEDNVSCYQQLAQKINQATVSHDFLSLTEQGGIPWDDEKSVNEDVQRLFTNLQDLISTRLPEAASGPSQKAVIGRYRDILLNLRSDFEKSKLTVQRAKERNELFGAASNSGATGDIDTGMDHLLRERSHIQNSLNTASSVIGQADSIRSDLRFQGRSMRNAGSMLGQLTSNIPGLNYLTEQIRRRRSRDEMIVAGVIATCIFFTMWYVLG